MKRSPRSPVKKPAAVKTSPAAEKKPAELSFWPLFWKSALLSLLIAAVMLAITALVIGAWGYSRFRQFLSAADLKQEDFISQLRIGWEADPVSENGYKNILVLGTDSTSERGDVPALTDTMMLVSLDLNRGRINTLPLPRDLWNEEFQTKINALYAYGADRYPDQPEQFPAEVIGKMTDVPIHHTLVISLEHLKTLIDLVGGVEVTVENGFTDPQYPRTGVDVAVERDPAVLYESITFETGRQTLSGDRALQFIRSRHSEDEQGHDLARGERQQQVIEGLLAQVAKPKLLITQPQLAAELYRFYDRNFSHTLPITELVSTGKTLLNQESSLNFTSHQLSSTKDDPINGVLDNPPLSRAYQSQWVYVIDDQEKFKAVIQEAFFAGN